MFTLSDSRDTGCPILATADTVQEIHEAAERLGIPDAHTIILSDPHYRCTPPVVALEKNANGRITLGAILRPHGGM